MGDAMERVRAGDVRRMTSLSIRQIQDMAAKGDIPGAVKLGGVWTFDPSRVRAWIREKERCLANPETSTNARISGGVGSASTDESIEAAYEQLIRGKRHAASKAGERNSSVRR
jgi:predicted DNA-binding transcriptional regulator AlpA